MMTALLQIDSVVTAEQDIESSRASATSKQRSESETSRRIHKKRTRQEKADSASRRAGWTFLIPFLGVPVVAFYYFVQEDLMRAAAAAAATFGLALVLSPLMLWWAVSGLRRGSRHLLLGVFVGFVGAFLFTGLLGAIVSGGIGWSLVTGQPIGFLPESFDLTRWIFLSPENPLNPEPLSETVRELTRVP